MHVALEGAKTLKSSSLHQKRVKIEIIEHLIYLTSNHLFFEKYFPSCQGI